MVAIQLSKWVIFLDIVTIFWYLSGNWPLRRFFLMRGFRHEREEEGRASAW